MSPAIEYFVDLEKVDERWPMKGVLTPEGAIALNEGIRRAVFTAGEVVDIRGFPGSSTEFIIAKRDTKLFTTIDHR